MKKKNMNSLLVLLTGLCCLAGCAPTFSRELLDQVDSTTTFRELQNDPDRHVGKTFMLGGIILETRNTADSTIIQVLQRPLDRQGRPRETDETGGRFIIESPEFLDAAVYQPGKRISLIGQVTGQEVRPLGEIHYRYPVVSSKEVRLWETRQGPRFSFGVGIGVFHHF